MSKRCGPRLLALLVLVSLALSFGLPSVVATETVSEEYIASGTWLVATGFSFIGNLKSVDESIPYIGGAWLDPAGVYFNVVVSSTDDIYGSDLGSNVCLWHDDGSGTLQGSCSGPGCGTRVHTSDLTSHTSIVYIYAVLVSEQLDVCGGSMGTITADFF